MPSMADPHILSTLRAKRNEVEAAIKAYEARAEAARRDLAHINATLALFAVDGPPSEIRAYADTSRLFKRGELATLCRSALVEHGPQDTRELARRVAEAKGLDVADPLLRKALAYRIVQALTLQWKRRQLGSKGIRNGVRLWVLLSQRKTPE